MRMAAWTVAGLVLLAGCGHSADPVGENSAGSVRTTAVGTIVGTEPSPAATSAADGNAAAAPATADDIAADNADE